MNAERSIKHCPTCQIANGYPSHQDAWLRLTIHIQSWQFCSTVHTLEYYLLDTIGPSRANLSWWKYLWQKKHLLRADHPPSKNLRHHDLGASFHPRNTMFVQTRKIPVFWAFWVPKLPKTWTKKNNILSVREVYGIGIIWDYIAIVTSVWCSFFSEWPCWLGGCYRKRHN